MYLSFINCYPAYSTGPYTPDLEAELLFATQRALTNIMGVDRLRVQNVRLANDGSVIHLDATILDRFPAEGNCKGNVRRRNWGGLFHVLILGFFLYNYYLLRFRSIGQTQKNYANRKQINRYDKSIDHKKGQDNIGSSGRVSSYFFSYATRYVSLFSICKNITPAKYLVFLMVLNKNIAM